MSYMKSHFHDFVKSFLELGALLILPFMSLIRAMENDKRLADNPTRFFTFRGSQATGDSGGFTNNLWNFEQIIRDAKTDVNGKELDFVDFWPEYGQIGVILNGVYLHDRQGWTLQSHTATLDCQLTINDNVTDDAYITFIV